MSKKTLERGKQAVGDAVDAYFHEMDSDHNGFVCIDELSQSLRKRGLVATREQVDWVMENVDLDADGRISLEDFRIYVQKQDQKLKPIFDQFDITGTGHINEMDVLLAFDHIGMKVDEELVSRHLYRMDKNKTGLVNYSEFLVFYALLPAMQSIADQFDYLKSGVIDFDSEVTHSEYPQRNKSVTIASGMVAGAVSRTATAPLARFVLLLQASQGEKMTWAEGFKSMYREGGVRCFWRGNTANVYKIMPETSIKFLTNECVKPIISKDEKK